MTISEDGIPKAINLSPYNVESISCLDLQKTTEPISTGVGYFDHMLDQFNSHAQIGLSMTVKHIENCNKRMRTENGTSIKTHENDDEYKHTNRHDDLDHQDGLMAVVGFALGEEIDRLLSQSENCTTSYFGCPLDEALVTCSLSRPNSTTYAYNGLTQYTLSPFGKYKRQRIGTMQTSSLEYFWKALAQRSKLDVSLNKIRGDNAHHIVEASFKAFARALRNLLDGVNARQSSRDTTVDRLYGLGSENRLASIALGRSGNVTRETKETRITVTLKLCTDDETTAANGTKHSTIDTGIAALDLFWTDFATAANISLSINCKGDLWIDEHHTTEDVAIAVGQCLNQALGSKAGLVRMWTACASVTHAADNSTSDIQAVMDLSNRPCFFHNLHLVHDDDASDPIETVDGLSLEMFEHALDSLVVNARMTLHLVQTDSVPCDKITNEYLQGLMNATAVAIGKALMYCSTVDVRRAGATASSKGTLSV